MLNLQNCSICHSICHRITVGGRLVRTTHNNFIKNWNVLTVRQTLIPPNWRPSQSMYYRVDEIIKSFGLGAICDRKQNNWKALDQHFLWFNYPTFLDSNDKTLCLKKKNTCYVVSTGNSYQTGLSESSRPRSELSWVIHTDDDSIWLRLKLVTKLATPHVERNPSFRTYAYFISLSGRQPWKILR